MPKIPFLAVSGGILVVPSVNASGEAVPAGILQSTNTLLSHGNLLFIDSILFLTEDRVASLYKEFAYLETGPVIGPWFEAPYLSHLIKLLKRRNDTTRLAKFLEASGEDLSNYLKRQGGR